MNSRLAPMIDGTELLKTGCSFWSVVPRLDGTVGQELAVDCDNRRWDWIHKSAGRYSPWIFK